MDDDIITELKEDAQKAYEWIKDKVITGGTYMLMTLGVLSSEATSNVNESKDNFDRHVDRREVTHNPQNLNFIPGPLLDRTEHYVQQMYNNLEKNEDNTVSLSTLMEKGKVTPEDLQAVFSENKELLFQLQPGRTNEQYATAAVINSNKGCAGGCLSGIQKMSYMVEGNNRILDKYSNNWKGVGADGEKRSACDAYLALENSGLYTTITLPNLAYKGHYGCEETDTMRNFNSQLPIGTLVCIDARYTDEERGYRDTGDGQTHGHIWTLDKQHRTISDGLEPNGPSFHNYGENIHISLSHDIKVPPEVAHKVLEHSMNRMQQEIEQELQQQQVIPFTSISINRFPYERGK